MLTRSSVAALNRHRLTFHFLPYGDPVFHLKMIHTHLQECKSVSKLLERLLLVLTLNPRTPEGIVGVLLQNQDELSNNCLREKQFVAAVFHSYTFHFVCSK